MSNPTNTAGAAPLMTPQEVAAMFRVDPKTVTRWSRAGKLTSIRTLGGHRRYARDEVEALLCGESSETAQERGRPVIDAITGVTVRAHA